MKTHIIIKIITGFIFFLFLAEFTALSQKKIKIRNVEGSYIISQDVTLKRAREEAIIEAKKEALRKAGISENISSTNVLSKSSGDGFSQVFNEFSSVELNGKVIDWEVTEEEIKKDEFGNLTSWVQLDAEVIKYETTSDPSFKIKVTGIEEFYKEGSKMSFTVHPHKEGYLKIFYFDEELNCDMIYPNAYENNRLFEKGQEIKFPISPMIEYEMVTDSDKEVNHLVFVFLKKDIPFLENVSYKQLIKWLYAIPPAQRQVEFFSYVISANN